MYFESESALAQTGRFYHRGGMLVELAANGKTHPVSSATGHIALARAANWINRSRDVDGNVASKKVDPPHEIAAALVKTHIWNAIQELIGVVDHPLFVDSGELLAPGYDPKTKLFGHFEHDPKINFTAGLADARQAAEYISQLFSTLDLASEADKAAVLCSILTAVSRPALKTAPLFLITAPVFGSGKGLLARLISGFAQAGEPNSKTLQGNDDEIKKEIISSLIGSAPVLFFDEVGGQEIDSVSLRTLATAETFSGRLLGSSKEVNLSTRTLILLTGNNIAPSADMARRMLEIRIDPKCETPATRKFSIDPIKILNENRSEMIQAALTIQAAYSNHLKSGSAGETEANLPGIGSFSEWDRWCRRPIFWLTGVDPAQRLLDQLKADPDRAEIADVFCEWNRKFGSDYVVSAQIQNAPKVYEAITVFANQKDMSTKDISRWISKHQGRIVGGLRIEKSDSITNKIKWRVARV